MHKRTHNWAHNIQTTHNKTKISIYEENNISQNGAKHDYQQWNTGQRHKAEMMLKNCCNSNCISKSKNLTTYLRVRSR